MKDTNKARPVLAYGLASHSSHHHLQNSPSTNHLGLRFRYPSNTNLTPSQHHTHHSPAAQATYSRNDY